MKFLQHMILFSLLNEMNSTVTRPKVQENETRVKKSEELNIQREKSTPLSKGRLAMFNVLHEGII